MHSFTEALAASRDKPENRWLFELLAKTLSDEIIWGKHTPGSKYVPAGAKQFYECHYNGYVVRLDYERLRRAWFLGDTFSTVMIYDSRVNLLMQAVGEQMDIGLGKQELRHDFLREWDLVHGKPWLRPKEQEVLDYITEYKDREKMEILDNIARMLTGPSYELWVDEYEKTSGDKWK